jgi:predicted RNA-binding protein with PIN domain
VLVIDGMNVVGSRPDGWWRDRDGAVRRLVERLGVLTRPHERLIVIFDGKAPEDLPDGSYRGVEVRFEHREGANAADDAIVRVLTDELVGCEVTVVTSDRALQARAEARGAATLGAKAFLHQLDEVEAQRAARPTR